MNSTMEKFTSPNTVLRLFYPNGKLAKLYFIDPYDSVNGAQFVNLKISELTDSTFGAWFCHIICVLNNTFDFSRLGTWRAEILSPTGSIFASIEFPVFYSPSDELEKNREYTSALFNQLVDKHFEILSVCYRKQPKINDLLNLLNLGSCEKTKWSSVFPDEKSEINLVSMERNWES